MKTQQSDPRVMCQVKRDLEVVTLKGMVQYDIVMDRTRIASTSVWLSQWGPLLTTGKLAWGYTPECPSLTTFS